MCWIKRKKCHYDILYSLSLNYPHSSWLPSSIVITPGGEKREEPRGNLYYIWAKILRSETDATYPLSFDIFVFVVKIGILTPDHSDSPAALPANRKIQSLTSSEQQQEQQEQQLFAIQTSLQPSKPLYLTMQISRALKLFVTAKSFASKQGCIVSAMHDHYANGRGSARAYGGEGPEIAQDYVGGEGLLLYCAIHCIIHSFCHDFIEPSNTMPFSTLILKLTLTIQEVDSVSARNLVGGDGDSLLNNGTGDFESTIGHGSKSDNQNVLHGLGDHFSTYVNNADVMVRPYSSFRCISLSFILLNDLFLNAISLRFIVSSHLTRIPFSLC